MKDSKKEEQMKKKGEWRPFSISKHAGSLMWSATSSKLAILLSSLFCYGKNVGAILKMATEGVPFWKMAKILDNSVFKSPSNTILNDS